MNFNFAPYNDDFDENKNYHSILFKPQHAVQARELNVMQSVLQNQVATIGNHLFKNGAKITGCSTTFVQYDYVRLNDKQDNAPIDLTLYNNKKLKLVGKASGVEATIIDITHKNEYNPNTLYIVYTKTGIDNIQSVFLNGEEIEFKDENDVVVYVVTVKCPSCEGSTDVSDIISPTGKSLFFLIDDGVFYYNGNFVKITKQHIIIEKYLKKDTKGNVLSDMTYCIVLKPKEDVVTALDDDTLYDPHEGTPNYASTGADRYNLNLNLNITTYNLTNNINIENNTIIENTIEETNLVVLAKVRQNHTVEFKKDDTEYNQIMKEIARRTYETSGDFTYVPWKAKVNHHKLDEKNPNGWVENGDDAKYVAIVDTGIGYVYGSRVENNAEVAVIGNKTRATRKMRGASISITSRANFLIKINPDDKLCWINHVASSTLTNQNFNLYDSSDNIMGVCKVYDIHKVDEDSYRVYVYNIVMNNSSKFIDVSKFKCADYSLVGDIEENVLMNNANNNTLLFHLGYESIKSIRDYDNSNNGNTTVEFRKRLNGILDGNGRITFTSSTNEYFVSLLQSNPICWVGNNPTAITKVLNSSNTGHTKNSITIDLGTAFASQSVTVITSVVKTSQTENTKTLTVNTYTTSNKPNGVIGDILVLPHADGYKLQSVKVVDIADVTVNIDVTNEYTFNSGQTDNFYTACSITRNVTRLFTDDQRIVVTYSYFEHSGSAGFFTVDSYSQLINDPDLDLTYADIPTYTDSNGIVYNLSDYVDFRTINLNGLEVDITKPIANFNSSMIFDVEYYLGRCDLLLVNSNGEFYIKEGIPSEKPVYPNKDDASMILYHIYLNPYVYKINDIKLQFIDNRRFTMNDISKLEKRISNLEYYVTLNQLESETVNMSIKDANGLDRYKNGFIVDNFKGYTASDINHPEFKASLDRKNGILRPQFKQNNIKLGIDKAKSGKFKFVGNMAILDYKHDLFIQNNYATHAISINPYLIFNKKGSMVLSPNMDTWSDTETLPNVSTTIDTGVQALTDIADASGLLGLDYSSWIDLNQSILQTSNTVTTETETEIRDVTTTTTTTTTNSQRTVTNTSIGSETQSYTIDDIVKDVSIIPYIREKTVQFTATNLRANTRVYAFFDGVDVNQYCRVMSLTTNSALGGDMLVTDNNGTIRGEFVIPSGKFFTGEKTFVLTNDPNNSGNPDIETTRCEATYFAGGLSQTKQSSTLNVLTPTFTRTSNTENRTTTSVSRDVNTVVTEIPQPPPIVEEPQVEPVVEEFDWGTFWSSWLASDPVAQGFKVEESCFISKVGVYFEQIDLNSDVVWFEIREMINGYPSKDHITRKEIKTSRLNNFVSADASKEYQVEFNFPVYVDSSKSYAFVVGGASPDTKVYISKLGNSLLNNPNSILEHPPLQFTMFRSLNGETWNAEQLETMKINIYRCVFKYADANIVFKAVDEDNTSYHKCIDNPIEIEQGSNKVRIYAKDHGLRSSDRVVISFSKNIFYEIDDLNNVPKSGQTFTTLSGSGIVDKVRLKSNGKYELSLIKVVGVIKKNQLFTCDSMQYTSRDNVAVEQIGADVQTIIIPSVQGTTTNNISQEVYETISGVNVDKFAKEHIVKEVDSIDTFIIEINQPFNSSGRFGDNNVSLQGVNIKYDMFNVSGQYLSYNTQDSWTAKPYLFNGGSEELFIQPLADNYVNNPMILLSDLNENNGSVESFELSINSKLKNLYVSPVYNVDTFSITTVSNRLDNITESTINVSPNSNRYIDETDGINGIESFKYITTKVLLNNSAYDIKLFVDVLCGDTSDFDVYVKLYTIDGLNEEDVNWIKYDKITKIKTSVSEIEYEMSLSDNVNNWNEVEFIGFRVKLVGKGTNSSRPPIFKNLRAIAVT